MTRYFRSEEGLKQGFGCRRSWPSWPAPLGSASPSLLPSFTGKAPVATACRGVHMAPPSPAWLAHWSAVSLTAAVGSGRSVCSTCATPARLPRPHSLPLPSLRSVRVVFEPHRLSPQTWPLPLPPSLTPHQLQSDGRVSSTVGRADAGVSPGERMSPAIPPTLAACFCAQPAHPLSLDHFTASCRLRRWLFFENTGAKTPADRVALSA